MLIVKDKKRTILNTWDPSLPSCTPQWHPPPWNFPTTTQILHSLPNQTTMHHHFLLNPNTTHHPWHKGRIKNLHFWISYTILFTFFYLIFEVKVFSHGAHRLTPSFSSMSMVLNDRGEIFLLHLNVGCLSSSDLHLNQIYCK